MFSFIFLFIYGKFEIKRTEGFFLRLYNYIRIRIVNFFSFIFFLWYKCIVRFFEFFLFKWLKLCYKIDSFCFVFYVFCSRFEVKFYFLRRVLFYREGFGDNCVGFLCFVFLFFFGCVFFNFIKLLDRFFRIKVWWSCFSMWEEVVVKLSFFVFCWFNW